MKLSTKSAGFCVSVSKGRGHGTIVPNLVSEMLHTALARVGVKDGLTFAYQATGVCRSLFSSASKYVMTVTPAKGRMIRVNMKYDKAHTSTVTGLLHLPSGVELAGMYEKLKCVAAELNKDQWKSLGGSAEAEEGQQDVPKPKPPHVHLVVSHPVPVPSSIAANAGQKHEGETMKQTAVVATSEVKASDQNDVYAVILMEALKTLKKPEFTIKEIAPVVYEHFPGRNTHGLASGVAMKMKGLGWLRRVSVEGLWQVEAKFLADYKLDLVVKPLPVCDFAKRKSDKKVKKVKVAKTAAKPILPTNHQVDAARAPVVDKVKVLASSDTLSRIIVLQEKKRELDLALKRVNGELHSVVSELETLTESLTREDLLKIVLETLK